MEQIKLERVCPLFFFCRKSVGPVLGLQWRGGGCVLARVQREKKNKRGVEQAQGRRQRRW